MKSILFVAIVLLLFRVLDVGYKGWNGAVSSSSGVAVIGNNALSSLIATTFGGATGAVIEKKWTNKRTKFEIRFQNKNIPAWRINFMLQCIIKVKRRIAFIRSLSSLYLIL